MTATPTIRMGSRVLIMPRLRPLMMRVAVPVLEDSDRFWVGLYVSEV